LKLKKRGSESQFNRWHVILPNILILAIVIAFTFVVAPLSATSSPKVHSDSMLQISDSSASTLQSQFTFNQTACKYQKSDGENWLEFTVTVVNKLNHSLNFKMGNITLQQVVMSNGRLYFPVENASSVFGPQNGTQWVGQIRFPITGPIFGNAQALSVVLFVRIEIEGQSQPLITALPVSISTPSSYATCS
jgi:hypothetical protein